MNKRSIVSTISLLIFWIVISGVISLEHIIVGTFISVFLVWFWQSLNLRLPSLLSPKELLLFLRSILVLIGFVIKSNIEVAKLLLFFSKSITPVFLQMELGVTTDWGRVFLASCITITPGTVTVDFDPDTNIFTIHALAGEMGENLYYWSIVTEINQLEKLVERRKIHAMDTGGIHDSNSIRSTKSDNRTHLD